MFIEKTIRKCNYTEKKNHTEISTDVFSFNLTYIVIVNFMCQFGEATVPRCLVSSQSGNLHEIIF